MDTDTDIVTDQQIADLQAFAARYSYDTAYLQELHHDSAEAFAAFAPAMGISHMRKALPLDAHYIARISTMLAADCGACANLNMRMALEAGLDRSVLLCLIERPEELPGDLAYVYAYTVSVVNNEPLNPDCFDRLLAQYGQEAMAELAVCITGSLMYPTLKRALGKQVCEVLAVPDGVTF